jgi:hypothetical protein
MEKSGELRAQDIISREENPRHPWDRRLGGPQNLSEHCGYMI